MITIVRYFKVRRHVIKYGIFIDPPRKVWEQHEIKIQMYLRECKKLKAIPVGTYVRHPTQNALVIRHYNMGANGARALAAPLLVCMSYR